MQGDLLQCNGPGGAGGCRSRSQSTHIREEKATKYGTSFSLECPNCALKQKDSYGRTLPPARRLTHEEAQRHAQNELDERQHDWEVEHGEGDWND